MAETRQVAEKLVSYLRLTGNIDSIFVDADDLFPNYVPYDRFGEFVQFVKDNFKIRAEHGLIRKVDFNKLSVDLIKDLLECCTIESLQFELDHTRFNVKAFHLIQTLKNIPNIGLRMMDFILDREQLLALRSLRYLTAHGNDPIDDDLLLELIKRRHRMIYIPTKLSSSDTIRRAFELISSCNQKQVVSLTVSDELFKEFIDLIGGMFNGDELVIENTNFTVVPYEETKLKVGEYTISYRNSVTCTVFKTNEQVQEWTMTMEKVMMKEENKP